jgi:hypothetical protein
MREAIADILAQEVNGATPARVDTYIEDVYSESQLSAGPSRSRPR